MSWLSDFRKLPERWVVVLAAVATLGIGTLDFITGWEFSMFFFYGLPIFVVGYAVNRRVAVAFALASASVWWLGNWSSHPYHSEIAFAWVTVTRTAYLLFVAFGAALLRNLEAYERERAGAVQRDLQREAELRRDILNELEEQQRHFGRELHDGVCQLLSGTALAMESLAKRLAPERPDEAAKCREAEGYVRKALTETRRLAHGLFPVQMGSEGLPVALDELVSMSTIVAEGVRVTFSQSGHTARLEPEAAMHLYRIAQEAVSNSIKHSKARNIAVKLSTAGGRVELEIADDGIGVRPESGMTRGIGLRTMNYRAAQMGALIQLLPRIPRGTRVVCLLSDDAGAKRRTNTLSP